MGGYEFFFDATKEGVTKYPTMLLGGYEKILVEEGGYDFFLRWKQIPSNPRYSSIYDRSLIWKTFENVFSSILVFHDFYQTPYTPCHKHNSTQESNT